MGLIRNLRPWSISSSKLAHFHSVLQPNKLREILLLFIGQLQDIRPGVILRKADALSHGSGSARLESGWPVLRLRDEILRYGRLQTQSELNEAGEDFANEYLLPFRIAPDQIVASWNWPQIVNYMEVNKGGYLQWHENVVLPAFEAHEKARKTLN